MQCERSEPNSSPAEGWRASVRRGGFSKKYCKFHRPYPCLRRDDKKNNKPTPSASRPPHPAGCGTPRRRMGPGRRLVRRSREVAMTMVWCFFYHTYRGHAFALFPSYRRRPVSNVFVFLWLWWNAMGPDLRRGDDVLVLFPSYRRRPVSNVFVFLWLWWNAMGPDLRRGDDVFVFFLSYWRKRIASAILKILALEFEKRIIKSL